MIKIPVAGGHAVIVDDEDFALASSYRWRVSNDGYAVAKAGGKLVLLHHLLLDVEDGMVRDHANGDRLDNRRANLRQATRLQNSVNAKKRIDNTSGYKGVYWNKQYQKWKAQIRHDGKRKFLGRFDSLIEAAQAYDRAAKEFFGQFARLNFPSS